MRPTRLGAIAALAAAAFIAIEIWLTGAAALLTRPLWLDEIHTLVVAGRGNLFESMQALRAGAETNAPTLFLLYRAVGLLTGGLSELPMRLVAVASVVVALSLVYLLLRDELGEIAAVCGVLAVWAQPVIVNVAFNARFYGPWLAAVAGLLYVLRRAVSGPWTWRGAIALGVVSALVSTIHYFGILSWVMAVATAAALGRRSMLTITRRLLPALAGPIALGACLPIYFAQRAALTNATWVPAASLADHAFLLVTSFAALGLLVALAAWGASRVLRRVAPANAAPRAVASFGVGSWLLLSQMGVAFAVILVSLLVQPATQPRYWIPASLAVAPLTALAVSRSLRPLQFAALVATVVASFTFVAGEGADARAFAGQVSVDSSYAVRVVSEKSTLVARRRHTLYPLLRAYPPAASSAILFAGPSIGRDSNLVAMDVRIARVHERFYGFPHIASAAELEKRGSFYFLEVDSARSPSPHEFPGRTIERIAPRLFVIR